MASDKPKAIITRAVTRIISMPAACIVPFFSKRMPREAAAAPIARPNTTWAKIIYGRELRLPPVFIMIPIIVKR